MIKCPEFIHANNKLAGYEDRMGDGRSAFKF